MTDRDAVDTFMDGAHWALFFLEARLEETAPLDQQELKKAVREVRASLIRSRAARTPLLQGTN